MWTIVSAASSPFNLTPFWHFRCTDEAPFGFVGCDGFEIRFKNVSGTLLWSVSTAVVVPNLWMFPASVKRLAAQQPQKNGCTCVWIAFL